MRLLYFCMFFLATGAGLGQEVAAQTPAVPATRADAAGEVPVPLIPRRAFFGNPEKARARLSPDGKRLAFIAPVEGVLNVWVSEDDSPQRARPVTFDKHRGIVNFFWAFTSRHILYTQDKNGDEDDHVYCIDLASGEVKDLTPIPKIAAEIANVSERFPEDIVVGINDRGERQYHDLYRVNILTGQRTLLQENPGLAGFLVDDDYRVRFAVNITPQAGKELLRPAGGGRWEPYLSVDPLDAMTTHFVGFDKTGSKLYLLDSRQRDTAALAALDLTSGRQQTVAEDPRADLGGVLIHPTEKTVQAVSFTYTRTEWKVLDPAVAADFDYLRSVADGEIQITGRTLDDRRWTVAYLMDNGPVRFYLYDRQPQRQARFLFTSNPALEKLPLARMHPVVIPARDGLQLVSYLTLPPWTDPDGDGRPSAPLPMVLNVHGGPWARDEWGYDPEHQLLANRGYAVLSVNYRGSTGFGKHFLNAAQREWAGKMHDDLIDAVEWAIQQGIARRDRVGIMGGSYGGYATLVGLTFTPTTFACGVDIVGPSSLITLLENPPPYWASFMPVMKRFVGDWTTEEGRAFLASRSPLTYVDRIQRPLLIGQGANDPRVKKSEADQIVQAMTARKIPVTYVLFHDEGHGFARPENRFAFYAITEAFLATHLGGRYEPIGDAFRGADFSVPSGDDQVPGLPEALRAR